jgi:hypothetical protein
VYCRGQHGGGQAAPVRGHRPHQQVRSQINCAPRTRSWGQDQTYLARTGGRSPIQGRACSI